MSVTYEDLPTPPQGWDPRQTASSTPWNSHSYLYVSYDEVSSSMQKSCRRGRQWEAAQWALDMYCSGATGLRTNTWTRLLTVGVEDVGPADPMAVVLVNWCRIAAEANNGEDLLYVAMAADILARAKKTRVNDWMTGVYREVRGIKFETPDILHQRLLAALSKKSSPDIMMGEAWLYTNALFQWGQSKWMKAFYNIWKDNPYVAELGKIGTMKGWVTKGSHVLILLQ